jgi:hypothetical protein
MIFMLTSSASHNIAEFMYTVFLYVMVRSSSLVTKTWPPRSPDLTPLGS